MLGHSTVMMTERYAHFADSAIDLAARQTQRSEGSAKDPEADRAGPTPSSIAAITSDFADVEAVGRAGIEPATYGLKVRSSAN
jgi:hypothetical protein